MSSVLPSGVVSKCGNNFLLYGQMKGTLLLLLSLLFPQWQAAAHLDHLSEGGISESEKGITRITLEMIVLGNPSCNVTMVPESLGPSWLKYPKLWKFEPLFWTSEGPD